MKGRIKAKYVMQAELKLMSPLLIGGGFNDEADVEVIKLPDGKPYIPASSFAGRLRNEFRQFNSNEEQLNYLWGSNKFKDGQPKYQSHLILEDLTTNDETTITIRDGVKIVAETGIAKKGSKYDYQIVEPGVSFKLYVEATLRDIDEIKSDDFEVSLKLLCALIKSPNIRIGALTNFGFGKLSCSCFNIYKFEFPKNSKEWFTYLSDETSPNLWDWEKSGKKIDLIPHNNFAIKACFQLKTSLLTATYGVNPNEPDKAQLKSNNQFILTGKSIKGAVRHRALKILSTKLDRIKAEEYLKNMMGWVNPDKPEEDAIRSRLRIEESNINDSVKGQEQPRIKINRFEGGTSKSALFNSEAVWRNGDKSFSLEFTLEKQHNWEAGLLLHILKDLWTGDLAIGGEKNIGRGVLMGKSALITWENTIVELEVDKDRKLYFKKGTPDDLLNFSNELNNLQTKIL